MSAKIINQQSNKSNKKIKKQEKRSLETAFYKLGIAVAEVAFFISFAALLFFPPKMN